MSPRSFFSSLLRAVLAISATSLLLFTASIVGALQNAHAASTLVVTTTADPTTCTTAISITESPVLAQD